MHSRTLLYVLISTLLFFSILIVAQQPYTGIYATDCSSQDNSNSVLGYTCNGLHRNCQAYLIFRAQPPYDTVPSISTLLNSSSSQLSEINSVSKTAAFDTNQEVIVPVNCSCSSNKYYQANTTYAVASGDTIFLIANDTYQSLSTCVSILDQNNKGPTSKIYPQETLLVPLRCACPTRNQSEMGIKYLLSYTVYPGDSISGTGLRFGADIGRIFEANEKSEEDDIIYSFTTLLIPLQDPPNSSQTVTPPLPSPPLLTPPPPPLPPASSRTRTWVYALVGVGVGGCLLLIIAGISFGVLTQKTERRPAASDKPLAKEYNDESQESMASIASLARTLKVFAFQELQYATENFSHKYWIKGSVFQGVINGDQVAIKKMNGDVTKEVELLNKVHHANLVNLLGICFDNGQWYLVYDYAANGPLSDWIHNEGNISKVLSWQKRMQIALDAATALDYLHRFTSPPHVHKDITSSHILLDDKFRAKIANFGLSRSVGREEGQFTLTKHIVGTKYYLAPEYVENGLITPKLDVYEFGIVLLEIISGKEPSEFHGRENDSTLDILGTVLKKENAKQNLRYLVDPSLHEDYPVDVVMSVVKLIESCVRKNPGSRPGMDEIVQFLSSL